MNTVFVKTPKAKREGAALSNNLMRVLSLIDGKSTSGELAKHAAPSLQNAWCELLNELLKGGYIVDNSEVIPQEQIAPSKLNHLVDNFGGIFHKIIAPLVSNPVQKNQVTACVQAEPKTSASAKPTPEPDAIQKAEKAAHTAELKAYFAAEKEKAKAEAKQAAYDDAHAPAIQK